MTFFPFADDDLVFEVADGRWYSYPPGEEPEGLEPVDVSALRERFDPEPENKVGVAPYNGRTIALTRKKRNGARS